MKKALGSLVAIALTSAAGAALAQTSTSVDALGGAWKVKYLEDGRWDREARLELNGSSGQYRFVGGMLNRGWDACDRAVAPVSVEQDADQVVVIAKFSQAVKFCPDRTIKLKRTGERTLEGAFGDGTRVSLTKD